METLEARPKEAAGAALVRSPDRLRAFFLNDKGRLPMDAGSPIDPENSHHPTEQKQQENPDKDPCDDGRSATRRKGRPARHRFSFQLTNLSAREGSNQKSGRYPSSLSGRPISTTTPALAAAIITASAIRSGANPHFG